MSEPARSEMEGKLEEKKPYVQPKLIVHGTLADLTRGLRYASVMENDYSYQYKSSSSGGSHLF